MLGNKMRSDEDEDEFDDCDSIDLTRYDRETRRAIHSIIGTLREWEASRARKESSEYRLAGPIRAGGGFCDDETMAESAAASLGMGTKMMPSSRYGLIQLDKK